MIFLILVYAFSQSFGSCEILRVNIPFCTVSFDKPLLLDQMCLGLANDKIIGNIQNKNRLCLLLSIPSKYNATVTMIHIWSRIL